MPENSSWQKSMKKWGPESYQESWRAGLENTPQYDRYEDEIQNEQTFLQLAERLEPMPEVGDHYTGAKILLYRGNKMARGHVVARSHDASGNSIGRAHLNHNLDTRMYQVAFAGGKLQNYSPTLLLNKCMPSVISRNE